MMDSERPALVKRFAFPCPGTVIGKHYNMIIMQINLMLNSKEIDTKVNEQIMKVQMYNKITNLLPSLYYGLYINTVAPSEMLEYYKKHYGKHPSSKADLNVILTDIERLTAKYKELFPDEPEKQPQQVQTKLKFEKLILGIELTLEVPINRKSKLYQLETYYESAIERIAQQKRQLEKYQH
jgi:hypothetical protein